ncbi:MAG: hypothetical protein A2087_08515 [Spirochaetes bacterium GWD1_61_31]|nr:MAG: hypothetical protein A2Y37_13300 [Spirochaetes bacterium GWB1_60_80]OHD32205.1 MAG: hypothetical protein A2004_10955 [Spirochaetes bacterium GWC1_61_12]OHD36716.1 MAG: hypothetical protein A2087_08515 [Spirochaetes bacterium GWD1_61_31]OHD42526.1 MAG: hypothetical protein A2Y35_08095 [Spirochaetes bacterium GWE1_60_18]OHD57890.1 MAG: hypothetical protein A2Y32_05165 [Spirochaetes bacterium GWF1_60_12]HAP44315.1 chemotaxis protein CheW [Spirochaetaceae bacterium]
MENVKTTELSQYLRFQLASEQYAFDVLKTREVLELTKITPLPNAMSYLSGVINLRGSVIPVVDLRKKFNLPMENHTINSAIIIVELTTAGELMVIGALVDAVKGVMRCERADLEPPPKFGMRLDAALVQAIAKRNGEFVIILDTDSIFAEKELWALGDKTTGEENGSPNTVDVSTLMPST